MVIPHSQMFSPRSFATEATRRCVRAMYYHCGIPMQAVSEYTLADYSLNAKLIIVPSPSVLTDKCWHALLAACRQGATVAISGVIDADDHGLPVVERSRLFNVNPSSEAVSQSETISIDSQEFTTRFEGEKIQRVEKAVFPRARVLLQPYGLGQFIWSPLPLELGDSMSAVVAFYKYALKQAQIAPIFKAEPYSPSVLVLPSVFRDVVFYMFVSETDQDTTMQVTHLETPAKFTVNVRAGRTMLAVLERKTGTLLSRDFRVY